MGFLNKRSFFSFLYSILPCNAKFKNVLQKLFILCEVKNGRQDKAVYFSYTF